MIDQKVDLKNKNRFDEAKKTLEDMQRIILPFTKPRIVINSSTHGLWENNPNDKNNENIKPLNYTKRD